MPAFISIFKKLSPFFIFAGTLVSSVSFAADAGGKGNVYTPEDDDFSNSPFTEYGEFNEEDEEAADTKFFQYGRFFGVSLGLGFEGVTGNRGYLWQGGFPMLDFKVHYWFDFNLALDLGFFTTPHFFQIEETQGEGERTNATLSRLGINLKYYFDTKNMSSALSFANPYLLLGAGSFTKTQTASSEEATPDSDSAFGVSAGAGLEFTLKPRKAFFAIEGKIHAVNFKDTRTNELQNTALGLDDLTGYFYTVSGNFLFTW